MSFITPYDIGKSFDDFDFEIIKITPDKPYELSFTPREIIECKVNGKYMILNCGVNRSVAEAFGIDIEDSVRDVIKTEAVLKLINSKNYLRKRKVEHILR